MVVLAAASLGGWTFWKKQNANPAGTSAQTTQLERQQADVPFDTSLARTLAEADSAAAPAAVPLSDTTFHNAPASSDTAIQAPPGTGSTESDIRWVTATAITWANVRSDPIRQAGIVAVISPDTRVRLGDARDGWHRVKAGGIEGWVDRRLFAVDELKRPR
ncbi:MAG: SH3 domain-containing protein [Gemmatimonadaceae bacterium]